MLCYFSPDPKIPDSLRLERMQQMFDADRAILVEDYEHFSGVKIKLDIAEDSQCLSVVRPHEDIRPSKAGRKSAVSCEPQCQEPS